MHVPLRRREIHVPGQFLNCACRRPPHREVRTKRVSQPMHAALSELRTSDCPSHVVLDDLLRERRPIPLTEHPRATQMSVVAQCRQPERQRYIARPSTFGGR